MGLFATLHKRHSALNDIHYAECRVIFIAMLNVVRLSVVAPLLLYPSKLLTAYAIYFHPSSLFAGRAGSLPHSLRQILGGSECQWQTQAY
jgi:hypothetical protein